MIDVLLVSFLAIVTSTSLAVNASVWYKLGKIETKISNLEQGD